MSIEIDFFHIGPQFNSYLIQANLEKVIFNSFWIVLSHNYKSLIS